MIQRLFKIGFLAALVVLTATSIYAQPDASDPGPTGNSGRRLRESMDLKAMLAKQRLERDKKDHRELLERGEMALKLVNDLEASFTETRSISSEDKARLESLEELVKKIRREIGADDDDDGAESMMKSAEESRPSTIEDAFQYLQTTTVKLVDELKKTTRFTISAIAIQSSNGLLRVVKFLRLRK